MTRRLAASSLPSQIESFGRAFVIREKDGVSVSNRVGRGGWPTSGVLELQKSRESEFGNLIAGYLSDEDHVAYEKLRNLGESLLRLGVKGDYYVLTTRKQYSSENRDDNDVLSEVLNILNDYTNNRLKSDEATKRMMSLGK